MFAISKYYYDSNYFSIIDSPNKAYWLGFLYADGCINQFYKNEKLKAMNLEICLCEEDKKHLEKFVTCLNSNVKICEKNARLNNKVFKSYRTAINCTKLCRDLINLGCTPRKTYNLKFPTYDKVPYIYIKDFIRGYFDGDGCISVTNMCGKNHIVLVLTGMSDMLESISDFLISEKILRKKPKLIKDKRSNVYSIRMYGEDAIKDILDYMYKDSEMYLDRKYKKYIDFYKDYDENTPIRGVYFSSRNKAYIVRIIKDGRRIRIGQYKNVKDANDARRKAEIDKLLPA